MKALWILPKKTFPIDDGARVASHALASAISKQVESMDVAYYDEPGVKVNLDYQQLWQAQNVFKLDKVRIRHITLRYLFWLWRFVSAPLTPLTCGVFCGQKATQSFAKLLESQKYDLIIFDGLHPYVAARDAVSKSGVKVVYRAHNVESELWFTAAKQAGLMLATFYRWQGYLVKRVEQELAGRCEAVWAISEEDKAQFQQIKGGNALMVPVGMDFRQRGENPVGNLKLVFIGRMDWAPNKDGLKWFLDNVWPQVLAGRPDIELALVGSGDSEWLSAYKGLERTRVYGRVETIDDMYSQSDLSLIPIFYGSGTRIKVIESVSFAVPVLSTQMGVQGSGLERGDYLMAQNVREWVDLLLKVQRADLEVISDRARSRLLSIMEPQLIAKNALMSLDRA